MPFYGGVIGVNQISGPDNYDKSKYQINGISVDKGSLSVDENKGNFSFTVFKVNNFDLT